MLIAIYKITYSSGGYFKGNFVNGNKHGRGTAVFKNGSIYQGNWEDNNINGRGKCIFKSGDVYIGEWKNNEMHGKGKYFYKDGSIFEGTWENGHKNGFGILTTKYASYEGEWINNIWGQNTTIPGNYIVQKFRRSKRLEQKNLI